MKTLLYKYFRLAAQPQTYMFCAFGAMFLIPSYPYTIVFFYIVLGLFFTYINAREMRDVYFTMLLPVKKKDYVTACTWFMVLIEGISLIIGIPFALLSHRINPAGNVVGFDASLALYGAGLLMYGVFNVIFLTSFFRTAYKVGISFLKAVIPMAVLEIVLEVLPHIPALSFLDGWTAVGLQFIFFVVGLLIFCLLTFLGARKAQTLFEAVDL